MDKDKILSKARAEKKDEREEQIEIKSFKIGWYGLTLMIIILLGLQLYFEKSSSTELSLVLVTHLLSATYYRYKKMGNITYLIMSLVLLVTIVLDISALLSQYGAF